MQAWQRGDRCWMARLRTAGEVIEATTLWSQTRFRVWLPERDAIVSVGGEDLALIDQASPGADRLMYLAAAARIADALAENVLLAPPPGVRNRRIALLEAETAAWRQKARSEMQTAPTLTAICMLRVGD